MQEVKEEAYKSEIGVQSLSPYEIHTYTIACRINSMKIVFLVNGYPRKKSLITKKS